MLRHQYLEFHWKYYIKSDIVSAQMELYAVEIFLQLVLASTDMTNINVLRDWRSSEM